MAVSSSNGVSDNSIPQNVIIKLFSFSIALFAVPLTAYFWSLKTLFHGENTLYAGIVAAVAVNVILLLYIIVAFREDSASSKETEKKKQ
ncbi:vacuolar H-ATPase assembly protein Vma21 [Schizosaccharomyces japonicus yFS275]|uniref:Vacuolar H-ATPase assembly protein Vma21 n=1 Tax=Schizosaccharomyces japonicus (strain yFS275 / FY16936) TaxID=402676 RepID=B6JZB0_SCHJY|nr:vacuolar H-ATPase assembly protein Vma21 [Schizosaccharomyces japonicus yFS275]EEB06878.1 vacuolar H-ATPase assembly protein Vma21 [Schizosaccharomyces japonicus yFS275]